jgi:hypothetical protein
MNPIAIFYHCRLDGAPKSETYWEKRDASITRSVSVPIFWDQMEALKRCGLEAVAEKIFLCVNGDRLVPEESWPKNVSILCHGAKAQSLRPTLHFLQNWLPGHEAWNVLFFHSKGVTHPNDPLTEAWRLCMERVVLGRWRECVALLDAGYDTVGAHWVTVPFGVEDAMAFPFMAHKTGKTTSYWGGNFWWAKASFLRKLPTFRPEIIKPKDWHLPELWIGSGPEPRVKDLAPHFPGLNTCGRT